MTGPRRCAFCPAPIERKVFGAYCEPRSSFEKRLHCDHSCCAAANARVPLSPARIVMHGIAFYLESGPHRAWIGRSTLHAWIRAGYLVREDGWVWRTPAGEEYVRRRAERAA